jgi:hypothetical protein
MGRAQTWECATMDRQKGGVDSKILDSGDRWKFVDSPECGEHERLLSV